MLPGCPAHNQTNNPYVNAGSGGSISILYVHVSISAQHVKEPTAGIPAHTEAYREAGGEREREGGRDRQTDKQTDRQRQTET